MADKKKYTVIHPVRHDGKLCPRGTEISLNDEDAARLLLRGVIGSGTAEVVVIKQAGPTTAETLDHFNKLNGMTKPELVEHALKAYNLPLATDDKKEALIGAIHTRYVETYVPMVEGDDNREKEATE